VLGELLDARDFLVRPEPARLVRRSQLVEALRAQLAAVRTFDGQRILAGRLESPVAVRLLPELKGPRPLGRAGRHHRRGKPARPEWIEQIGAIRAGPRQSVLEVQSELETEQGVFEIGTFIWWD